MFHRDRIQEFHDRSSFRRLGLAVYLGRGLSPSAKGLELASVGWPLLGPVVTTTTAGGKKGRWPNLSRNYGVHPTKNPFSGSPGFLRFTVKKQPPTPPDST